MYINVYIMRELIYIAIILLVIFIVYRYNKTEGMIPLNESRVVILHYTNWCPACKRFRPTYEAVKSGLKDTKIKFIEKDESVNPSVGITAYPTLILIDEHGKRHKYVGGMNYDAMVTWVTAPSFYS